LLLFWAEKCVKTYLLKGNEDRDKGYVSSHPGNGRKQESPETKKLIFGI